MTFRRRRGPTVHGPLTEKQQAAREQSSAWWAAQRARWEAGLPVPESASRRFTGKRAASADHRGQFQPVRVTVSRRYSRPEPEIRIAPPRQTPSRTPVSASVYVPARGAVALSLLGQMHGRR